MATLETKAAGHELWIMMVLFGITLNHSMVLLGVNLSLADSFCLVLLVVMMAKKSLHIPLAPMMYFLTISMIVVVGSIFMTPRYFLYTPRPFKVMADYVKLVALLFYFLLGYNMAKAQVIDTSIKWYAMTAMVIGGVGVLWTALNMNIFSDRLFYAGVRYRGFVNDPNYFSLIQVTALAYFSRHRGIKKHHRPLAFAVVLGAVLVSGSKTGLITYMCYIALRLVAYSMKSERGTIVFMSAVFLVVPLVFLGSMGVEHITNMGHQMTINQPALERIQRLFTDFPGAISQGGSGRFSTWQTAFDIIKHAPLIGVGIGAYASVAFELTGRTDIAHNTYLQFSAEWGLPMAVVFFSYIFLALLKGIYLDDSAGEGDLILGDMLLILLIGSMAISLNNTRMFWFFLGGLVYKTTGDRKRRGKMG